MLLFAANHPACTADVHWPIVTSAMMFIGRMCRVAGVHWMAVTLADCHRMKTTKLIIFNDVNKIM